MYFLLAKIHLAITQKYPEKIIDNITGLRT
jgi:hypothetical protein